MAEKIRVLVVDDDTDFQASLAEALEREGYDVVQALSGKSGLEKLLEHDPDVIVLDIMMESVSEGYGLNQAIKYQARFAKYSDTPILMVSSIQETPDQRFPLAGEVDLIRPDLYFTKPLDMPRFLGALKRLAHSRASAATAAGRA